jgi:flagellar biosynthesis protein FliR
VIGAGEIGAGLLCFVRAAALFYAAPLLGDRAVPAKVRVGFAALAAFLVAGTREPVALAELPGLIPMEIALGLLAGFGARLVMATAETGGQLVGLTLGLGFANQVDPMQGEDSLPTRRMAMVIAGLAFLGAGGLEQLVGVLAAPTPQGSSMGMVFDQFVNAASFVLTGGLRLAAPILVVSVIVNLAAGLASRAAPAVNVFSVAFALVLVVGGIVLIASAPTFVRDLDLLGKQAAEYQLGR